MKKFKVLIIGYGSAGRRHAKILAKNKFYEKKILLSKLEACYFNILFTNDQAVGIAKLAIIIFKQSA